MNQPEVRICPICGGNMVYAIAWDDFSHKTESECVISRLEARIEAISRVNKRLREALR